MTTTSDGMRKRLARSLTGRFSATVGRGVAAADLSMEAKLSVKEGKKMEGEEGVQEERKEMEAGEVVVGEVEEMAGRAENREGRRRVRGQQRCSTVRGWDPITRKEVVRVEGEVG